MGRQKKIYDVSSEKLSVERACMLDNENKATRKQAGMVKSFDRFAYRQPMLDPDKAELLPEAYREESGTFEGKELENGWIERQGDGGREREGGGGGGRRPGAQVDHYDEKEQDDDEWENDDWENDDLDDYAGCV